MNRKVLVAAPVHPLLIKGLQDLGYDCQYLPNITNDQALLKIEEYEGVITSTRLNIDKQFIDQAISLKWVGRMGSGMEIMDTTYADEKGIFYCSSPAGNAHAVAEQALGMLLSLQHKILQAHLEIKEHIWRREENRGIEIAGRTAGIIGMGHNGTAFARMLHSMGVQVLAYDKYKTGYQEPGIEECNSLRAIQERAEILSFHVPLTRETTHYFDREFLSQMKQPFVLLNLSRGPVVDMEVLEDGLHSGRIFAAALDVWETEPYAKMDPNMQQRFDRLMQLPQFIGTPHIGGYTQNALVKMSQIVLDKISAFLTQ